jgi:hypothetical protein
MLALRTIPAAQGAVETAVTTPATTARLAQQIQVAAVVDLIIQAPLHPAVPASSS